MADTENVVAEMYEDNNTAIRSLKIKAPGEILRPDLVPLKIDLTGTTTGPQTLAISGTAHVTLQNKGDAKITTPFSVLIFEDTDLDGKYTQGIDNALGTGTSTLTLWPEGANIVDVPVSGTVRFLNALLYAMIDSGDAILEQDEANNLLISCKDCQVVPANPIQPVVKWRWKQQGVIITPPPVIINLTDDNNDGRIDEKDLPAVVFVMAHENFNLMSNYYHGRLWALRGDTGAPMFTYYDFNHAPSLVSAVAAADIDSDGKPEIILAGRSSGSWLGGGFVLALRNDGTLKWDNYAQAKTWTEQGPTYYGYVSEAGIPSIADIDSDGNPEIIVGKTAINGDGSIKWGRNYYGTTGTGSANGIIQSSQVVDLDLDGKQEVVAGFTAYNSDGSVRWSYPQYTDGITAIGNLDDDIYPEIVLVTNYQGRALVHLLDHDGQRRWGPVDLKTLNLPDTNFAGYGSPPTIADFDGDGEQEIGITGNGKYFILDKDGNLKRTLAVPGYNSQAIAATVFDLNGDGRPEVMIHTAGHFRIFDGQTGQMLFEDSFGAGGASYQNVLISDVNGDNQAEIVVRGFDSSSDTVKARDGIRVYGSKNNDWVSARKIWNQPGYHVTNVNDDGSIPQYEAPSWLLNNTYHTQAAIGQNPNPYLTPNVTASYLRAEQTGSSINLTVRIGNGGAKEAPAGVTVSFYDGDPLTGAVIGTASTTHILQQGEYQDIIYNWSGGIGLHHIYAVVDAANAVTECREDDNQTQLDFTVQTGLPDLKVGMEDIIIPAQITEGSIVPIRVTVHNIGTVSASNITVKFSNGNPASGGTWIGLPQIISSVSAGSSATVAFTFDTLGHAGQNMLYVSVDPDNTIGESTKANNMASFSINVQQPTLPNLIITTDGIQISPASPLEGNQVTISASITNRGSAVGNIPVRFSLGDPEAGGTMIAVPVIYPILSLGQSAQVQAVLDSTGWAGPQTVYVAIDPQNTITESSKSDNTASKALFIQSGGMTETVLVDKPSYQANDTVTATITAANTTASSRSLLMNVSVKDSTGNLITTVSSGDAVTISPNGSVTLTRTWNTGKTLSGSYTLVAELIDAGSAIARKSANFTILADNRIGAALTTDKVSYNPHESAAVTTVITSQSANYIFSGLTACISIGNPVGSGQLYTDTKTITTLIPGATYTFKTYWNTGTYPAGTYPVTLEVKDSTGAIIATGTQNLTIATIQKPSALLKGQISLDKQSLLSGETLTVSYSVKNVGNLDLQNVTLSVLTVHVANQTVYDMLTYQTTIPMAGLSGNTGQIDTTTYTAKDYLVVLRASINGSEETLAGTYFRVEGAPTAPSLVSPSNGSDVLTFMPILSVNNASDPNDDRLTYEFELYSDSGFTQILASSDAVAEAAGSTSWPVPVNLQENAAYFWRSRAYDGKLYGPWINPVSFRVNTVNDPPTAPMVSSPADNSAVAALTPTLTVTNASDPDSASLTYNFDVALEPSYNQVVASGKGIFPGQGTTSWQVPLALVENGTYYWRAQADDWFIEGTWSATAKFFVNTVNDAPTIPTILSPLNGEEVAALDIDIVATNSTDSDSPVITYYFEVDTVQTFDSVNILRSGRVPQGEGTTTWHVSGLTDNTFYYVRAKGGDGSAESPWSAPLTFFVNTSNDAPTMPTLANPSNGAGVNVFTPTLSVHNATDIDRDALTYEFEVYADSAITMLAANVTGIAETPQVTAWMVPVTLTENQTYYWRVRAFDGELYSSWTSLAKFTVNTANDAPGAPRFSSPPDGSSIDTLTPTLSVHNAIDPDSDTLTYDFEVYSGGVLVATLTGVYEGTSGITSATLNPVLPDNTLYQWRARAFDRDRYGPWTAMASFSIHIPQTNISATIDFDPDTLNKKSNGTWVVAYIELPSGYKPADIDISSVRLEGTIPAELHPSAIGDHDKDGIPDLMVKFKRSDVINLLSNGERVTVHVGGNLGTTTFEGIDIIKVMP